MDETLLPQIEAPRFTTAQPLLLAGITTRYTAQSSQAIPSQWQRFAPWLGHVPGQIGKVAYGVCCNGDDKGNFDYLCAVEVTDFAALPAELTSLRLPARRYAVFTHRDYVSTIRRSFNTIWNKWLPESGLEIADAPHFERYDEKFDPQSGHGGLEIWIPLKNE